MKYPSESGSSDQVTRDCLNQYGSDSNQTVYNLKKTSEVLVDR